MANKSRQCQLHYWGAREHGRKPEPKAKRYRLARPGLQSNLLTWTHHNPNQINVKCALIYM